MFGCKIVGLFSFPVKFISKGVNVVRSGLEEFFGGEGVGGKGQVLWRVDVDVLGLGECDVGLGGYLWVGWGFFHLAFIILV
jgi:hypothetical protein